MFLLCPKDPQMSVWVKVCSACTQPPPLRCSIPRIKDQFVENPVHSISCWVTVLWTSQWVVWWEGLEGLWHRAEEGQAQEKVHGNKHQFCVCSSLSYQLRFFSCISKSLLFLLAASSLLCRLFLCCEAINVSSCLFGGIRKKSVSTQSKPFP